MLIVKNSHSTEKALKQAKLPDIHSPQIYHSTVSRVKMENICQRTVTVLKHSLSGHEVPLPCILVWSVML